MPGGQELRIYKLAIRNPQSEIRDNVREPDSMLWVRMVRVAWRLVWPYPLAPWRSPLLRWRMETYGIRDERGGALSGATISPQAFFRFLVVNRVALVRFLRWAACLPRHNRLSR
jgi:hypothetical protein